MTRRLVEVPAIGPIGACLMVTKIVNPHAFRSGRRCAAWLGLTPKDHSTAGKQRLGGITRAGDESLRPPWSVGATAYIRRSRRGRTKPSPWLAELFKRKPPSSPRWRWPTRPRASPGSSWSAANATTAPGPRPARGSALRNTGARADPSPMAPHHDRR